MPTKARKPRPTAATRRPSTLTDALLTRWIKTRMGGL
jgi:hypothetical protein